MSIVEELQNRIIELERQIAAQATWVYYYPFGNLQAKQEIEEVAAKNKSRHVIVMPRLCGDPSMDAFGIERFDPPSTKQNTETN